MKKLLIGLGLIALLAGCASRENDNGMGGTSDQYQQSTTTSDQSMKTDSINKTSSGNSTDQINNNNATNSNTSQP